MFSVNSKSAMIKNKKRNLEDDMKEKNKHWM